jgi:hemerythrin-like domain-containing protein
MPRPRPKSKTPKAAPPRVLSFLQEEHRYMVDLLDVLEQAIERSDLRSESAHYLAQDVLNYMSSYPDAVHHPTEDVLFRHLGDALPAVRPLVRKQLREHELIEAESYRLLGQLDEAVKSADRDVREAFRQKVHVYGKRVRAHMRREEEELFPSAATVLGAAEWSEIESLLEAAEDPLHGQRVGDRFRLLYEFLAARADSVTGEIGRYNVVGFDALVESIDALDKAADQALRALGECLQQSMQHYRAAARLARGEQGYVARWSAPVGLTAGLLRTFAGTGRQLAVILAGALRGTSGPYLSALRRTPGTCPGQGSADRVPAEEF